MEGYRITTPYGDVYECAANGEVTRRNKHTWPLPHPSWQFTGASRTDLSFGRCAYTLAHLAGMPAASLRYKNGNPRYTLCDLDHGHKRVHGNTVHHGIRSIERIVLGAGT